MQEVIEFRKSVRTWLLGITGMSTHVSTDRVYYLGPQQKPTWPLIAFTLSREPTQGLGGYPGLHGWQGSCRIMLAGVDVNDLDAMEDLVHEDLADKDQDPIEERLSVSDKVMVAQFVVGSIDDDEPIPDETEEGYIAVVRPVVVNAAFVALAVG